MVRTLPPYWLLSSLTMTDRNFFASSTLKKPMKKISFSLEIVLKYKPFRAKQWPKYRKGKKDGAKTISIPFNKTKTSKNNFVILRKRFIFKRWSHKHTHKTWYWFVAFAVWRFWLSGNWKRAYRVITERRIPFSNSEKVTSKYHLVVQRKNDQAHNKLCPIMLLSFLHCDFCWF